MVITFPANHSSDPEWRKSRLVFVDPDDIKLLYWWPALVSFWWSCFKAYYSPF